MLQPPFKPTQRRILVGSAIALALFTSPFSYDFAHHEWQVNHAYAESCFIAGTRITMATGEDRTIETLQVGDLVLDQHGQANRILAIERVLLGDRKLYGLNNLPPFFTAEHPFLTTRGWAAIAPAITRAENNYLTVRPLFTGMQILCRPIEGQIMGNLKLAPQPEALLVESIYSIECPPTTPLFNLILDGSHSYIANSLIVHNKDGSGGNDSGGGNDHGGGGSNSSGGGSDHGDGGNDSGGGSDHGGGGSNSSGGGSDHGGGGSNSSGGGNDHGGGGSNSGSGEHAGGEQHGGGDRHAGGEQHAGGDNHAGGRGFGNGLDDNGVDAIDANGNKLRGDGTIDDNGVDAVDANGNKLRGDGTLDDRQPPLTDEQERALINNGFHEQE